MPPRIRSRFSMRCGMYWASEATMPYVRDFGAKAGGESSRWGIYPTKPPSAQAPSGTVCVRKWGAAPIFRPFEKMPESGALSFDRFRKTASYYGPERLSATITRPACGVGSVFRTSQSFPSTAANPFLLQLPDPFLPRLANPFLSRLP